MESHLPPPIIEAQRIVSGKKREDNSLEIRECGIVRDKSPTDGTLGKINVARSKKAAHKMINGHDGRYINRKQRQEEEEKAFVRNLFDEVENVGITVNLLTKSGLAENRAERDVNILEDSIIEACRNLKEDGLDSILDQYFGLDQLNEKKRKKQADGCTIASLLLMNAAMLHHRISTGGWLQKISGMDSIKNQTDVIDEIHSQWNRITRHDFLPVIEPAIEVIEAVRKSGKREGLNRALRHLACEAERIAEDYANLGADHAGPLFNKVMGNQASDGAYFTRPPSAALLARLTLDISAGDADWNSIATWKKHRAVDLACGSGTLIAALLTEMKRRAEKSGASTEQIAYFQKLAVEELIAGLEFNQISLQLAASQMTSGNSDIAYRKMQLYRMLYGEEDGDFKVGSLELISQSSILHTGQIPFPDVQLKSEQILLSENNPTLEDVTKAAKQTRIVIMNPPFTNRAKMGEKLHKKVQKGIRRKADKLRKWLVQADSEMKGYADKNSIGPLFVALADKCLDEKKGILSAIHPTVALTTISGLNERKVLASHFHIHTLLTCHIPKQVNLSQKTKINESMIIAQRYQGAHPSTRIISLDRMPLVDKDVAELHQHLLNCTSGTLPDGWGEVSEFPAKQIQKGDWSAVAFRSPRLALAASHIENETKLIPFSNQNISPRIASISKKTMTECCKTTLGSFPFFYSKGNEAQTTIKGVPDRYYASNNSSHKLNLTEVEDNNRSLGLYRNASHLLVTSGQDTSSGRLTAVANEKKYSGMGWMSVPNLTYVQAKAIAVFMNSTIGRLQLLRSPGKKLNYPKYNPGVYKNIQIPYLEDDSTISLLASCWDATQHMIVPQYRDGECKVRRMWDEAVAEALGWNPKKLTKWRKLLHMEPHVRGLGRNQYGE